MYSIRKGMHSRRLRYSLTAQHFMVESDPRGFTLLCWSCGLSSPEAFS